MGLAQTIGDNLMSRDAADDGKDGIRLCNKDASTDYKKYSTEQNIDAYVFFKALGAQTGDQKYTNEAESITKFVQNMYNKSLGYFNAGIKEDGNANTKFATDVQSMAIMAYGKDGLAAMGVNVDVLLTKTESNGKTTQTYNGVTIQGFGFTAHDNKISPEWTAQMVISYLVVAEDYETEGNTEKYTDPY